MYFKFIVWNIYSLLSEISSVNYSKYFKLSYSSPLSFPTGGELEEWDKGVKSRDSEVKDRSSEVGGWGYSTQVRENSSQKS